MTAPRPDEVENRVLVLAPTARDTALTNNLLDAAGIRCSCCDTLGRLVSELTEGAGAVLLCEESVLEGGGAGLERHLRSQPPWSDLPVLVLARQGADSPAVAAALAQLGNVVVLERPVRVSALVSAVQTALRARRRQYQAREHLMALQEADRRKDEFLAILAHELRNPLAPIRNSLHILRLTAPADSATEEVGAMMERQVNHMVRLVDDLMEVSRITRGKIELQRERVELAGVLRAAVETARPLIEGAGQKLTLSIPPDPLTMVGDAVRLSQVFANLLNNASKYTDAGGRIWLTVRRRNADILVSVRDDGRGMAPEVLSRIFDPFVQGDGHRTQSGLGIGLTLVKRLVEMHGGQVEARSAGPGQGSEFLVRLPLVPSRRMERESPQATLTDPVLGPRRVLVVDDNHDAAESLALLLRMQGAEVEVVFNGPDALEALSRHRPSVVLLDIGMPGMDGCEVAREIRQRPGFESATLIALTGWGQEEDRRRSQSAGFDHHLIKPADMVELEKLLVSLEP